MLRRSADHVDRPPQLSAAARRRRRVAGELVYRYSNSPRPLVATLGLSSARFSVPSRGRAAAASTDLSATTAPERITWSVGSRRVSSRPRTPPPRARRRGGLPQAACWITADPRRQSGPGPLAHEPGQPRATHGTPDLRRTSRTAQKSDAAAAIPRASISSRIGERAPPLARALAHGESGAEAIHASAATPRASISPKSASAPRAFSPPGLHAETPRGAWRRPRGRALAIPSRSARAANSWKRPILAMAMVVSPNLDVRAKRPERSRQCTHDVRAPPRADARRSSAAAAAAALSCDGTRASGESAAC